jgi:hypothetical protein
MMVFISCLSTFWLNSMKLRSRFSEAEDLENVVLEYVRSGSI